MPLPGRAAPSDVAASLLERLDAMPPRAAALLERAVVERIPIPELIARVGVAPRALAVGLWQAARAFEGAPVSPTPDEPAAMALLTALERGGPLPERAAGLSPLRTHAAEILAAAEARQLRRARWDGFVRAALAVALVAAAIWMSR